MFNTLANDGFKEEVFQPSAEYTQTVRSKFILIFAIFAISAKQQEASLSKDFIKQLSAYLESQPAVEQRVQMGFDFACQFQISTFAHLATEDAKLQLLQSMYELLKRQTDGALFGHDKLSFIIDQNLNQVVKLLKSLIQISQVCREVCIKILIQLGRVRSNPADYLSCIVAREKDEVILSDLSADMAHITRQVLVSSPEDCKAAQEQKQCTESLSVNRGVLYYYKAGQHKLDITCQDQFLTDGGVLYHLKRGKGLFKIGVGDGITKISGMIKKCNTSEFVKTMEPSSMFLLDTKLYVRDYCLSPQPFLVFDALTLEVDQDLSEKWKKHYEQELKKSEVPSAQTEEGALQVDVVHRSLLWHKDSKSGRTLEIAPLFTDGAIVFTISFQKQLVPDKPPMLILESYDPSRNFEFVKAQVLLQNDEPFVYDQNSLTFLRSAQFMTNGQILVMNIANSSICFFDLETGKLINQVKSEHMLMCYCPIKHKFYSIRSMQNQNQCLFEVAFDNFTPRAIQSMQSSESFEQIEQAFLKQVIETVGQQQEAQSVESLMEQIVYGGPSIKPSPKSPTSKAVVESNHILILKYLDLKRVQAELKMQSLDFIQVFKHANVTYLTGQTFAELITAATLFKETTFELLYILRLLQCNFKALIMCNGSLPVIMREYLSDYDKFFVLYNSVLRNKVYDTATTPVEIAIQQVCIEIMASSINILYKSQQEIVDKFLTELKENPEGINCSIFFDFFTLKANCEKLLNPNITGNSEIFMSACQIQYNYLVRQLKQKSTSSAAEYSASKFIKVYAQRVLVLYCEQLQKVSDRPASTQKLPQHMQDKYEEEATRLKHLQTQVMQIYSCLSDFFNESIQQVNTKSPDSNRIKNLLLQQSPFAQLQVCLFSTVFTAIDLDLEITCLVVAASMKIMQTLQVLITSATDEGFGWFKSVYRALAYLVSIKAYNLVKHQKVELQSTEQLLLQTNLLAGGIDEFFETEFSQVTRDLANQHQLIWRVQIDKLNVPAYYQLLIQVLDPTQRTTEVEAALKYLHQKLMKVDMVSAVNGSQVGMKLSLSAFAAALKLQDQVHLFEGLVESYPEFDLDCADLDNLMTLYHYANKTMRTWNHEIKNKISEKINTEIDAKFRKLKQDKIDKEEVKQLDTNFFTAEEQEQITQEQDRLFQLEIDRQYDSVSQIAHFLIKLVNPMIKESKPSSSQQDLLHSWRQMQKDSGSLRSMSVRHKEVMQSCAKEVVHLLTTTYDVSRIVKKVEDVYLAANRRATGLQFYSSLLQILQDDWAQPIFIDTVLWMNSALRDNQSKQVHYLDTLTGCGRRLEESISRTFFMTLQMVVKKLHNNSNTEAEVNLFINALKWRFSARDHFALSQLQLFQTLHKSQKLSIHWGKRIQTDFEDAAVKPQLKFQLKNDAQTVKDIQHIFDLHDDNKDGKLNYQECKDFFSTLCEKFGQNWELLVKSFDETWNLHQQDNKVTFDKLYKDLSLKTTKSTIAQQILSLFEQLFCSTVSRLIESDIGASLTVSSSHQFTRAKSVINQNSSEQLLSQMFQVIFAEFERYQLILKIKPGIDWQIYAQQRSKMPELISLSIDEYQLLDEYQPAKLVDEVVDSVEGESEDQKKTRLQSQEARRQESKALAEINTIARLYSETFLVRLVRLIDLFTSVSASQANLQAMAQRIASPVQLSTFISLLLLTPPRIKFLVIRILSALVSMKLPVELFEEAVNLQLQDLDGPVYQLFKKIQPQIQFKRSKFLACLHFYLLSITQKVWIKNAVESEGQYEISCELAKLIRATYESQESDEHPWRAETNQLINTLFSEMKSINRPREIEVLLSFIRGSDFHGIAPFQKVESGKDSLSVVGFASHEWLKRTSGSFKIEDTLRREDLAVLAVESNKDTQGNLKLIPASNLKISQTYSKHAFLLSAERINKLLSNIDFDCQDEIQNLNIKCKVLKLLNNQLTQNATKFLAALKESGCYEQLLKFVCKQSALEIKGNIVPIEWLEQSCFNIRKQACENQLSLLKTQSTQMKLVGDKIYAAVLNPNSEHDKVYTRTKLLSAFNHKAFVQRKEVKLLNGSDLQISEDTAVEVQVALVEPSDFQDGAAVEILNHSVAVITYDVELSALIQTLRSKSSAVDDLDQKSIFVVSRQDYERLHSLGQIQDAQNQSNSLDDQFSESLVKFGGYSPLVAQKTKQVKEGVEQKTKFLFELNAKIASGSIELKEEEEAVPTKSDSVYSEIPAECSSENLTLLDQNNKSQNSCRQENEKEKPIKPMEGRFWQDTNVEEGENLASLYESQVKRLVNMYCRHIFWSLVQRDKLDKLFDFLLKTEQDMKAFVTFIKVVGNECYVTANTQSIKNFKTFIKNVVLITMRCGQYRPLLKMLFRDIVDQYRLHYRSSNNIAVQMQSISALFITESQAAQLMNPYVILPILKNVISHCEFLHELPIPDIVSILLAINSSFSGEFQLKDKYWYQLIQLLNKLPTETVIQVCQLPIVEALFKDLEQQEAEESQEWLWVASRLRTKEFEPDQAFKQAWEQKGRIMQKFQRYEPKKSFNLQQLELVFQLYKLSRKSSFFYRNNLTSYLNMHGQLMQEQPDGPMSKHLLYMSQLPIEQQFVQHEHTMTTSQIQIPNTDSEKVLLLIKPTSTMKVNQKVVVSADPDLKHVVARFTQKDVSSGNALCQVYDQNAYVTVTQGIQNFTIDLSAATLSFAPSSIRIDQEILQKQDKYISTPKGVFVIRDEPQITRSSVYQLKDHLQFKQITFGKDCTIALLPNNQVIGWGKSKLRHFKDTQHYDGNKDDDCIPLTVQTIGKTQEEKAQQREIVEIQTFKRTTVCLTKAGQVFCCGDKFAKGIKLQNQPFGFYQVFCDLQPVVKKEVAAQEAPAKVEADPENILELFGDVIEQQEALPQVQEEVKPEIVDEQESKELIEQPKSEIVEEVQSLDAPDQPVEPVSVSEEQKECSDEEYKSSKSQEEEPKTLSHSAPVHNLQEEFSSAQGDEEPIHVDEIQIDENSEQEEEEYVPKQDEPIEEVKEQIQELVAPHAIQVWISKTKSSKDIVILALFKLESGLYQFRTAGNNKFGLLGQGKDTKESNMLRVVDFGMELSQIDQVAVGYNHFIIRADGKVFAWGCYSSDSEERMIWSPTEITFFQQYKIKSIQSGNSHTVALVEQVGHQDYFVCGKFMPLHSENSYKTLKEAVPVQSWFVDQSTLMVTSSPQQVDLTDLKIEISSAQDYGFQPHNSEGYIQFEEKLKLPEGTSSKQVIQVMLDYIYTRIKDNQFEDVQWKEIAADEIKLELDEQMKKQWLLLVVNYCRHIWGHLSYVQGKIQKSKGMLIIQNFIANRHNVPMCIKNKLLKSIMHTLHKDEAKDQISIHIQRLKAKEMLKEGKTDTKFEWSVFAKVSEALRKANFKGMHQNTQQSRAWFVKFIGESSNDDGGLFRESITELCIELQSTALDLFVPCGNQVGKIGENRDCWLINPKATSKLHLRKFYFIGALFGMCVRSGILMNLNLAPIVWKRLTGDKLRNEDIQAIDQTFATNLTRLMEYKNSGKSEKEFKEAFNLFMQCQNSAGDMVDLVENGQNIAVTYSTLESYIKKCYKLRLTESREQYKAITDGFDRTFKSSYLKMVSWRDLELKVVGNEEIDFARLKEMTQYKNCTASHEVVKRFWRVLQSFDNEDRKKYLRFVWGRMRLPPREETDIEQHTVQLDESKKKTDYPFGRTCYFRIELPPYSTDEMLKQRLLYALENTGSIDGDHNNVGNEAVEEPRDERSENDSDSGDEALRADADRVRRMRDEEDRRLNDYGDEDEGQGEEE